MADTIIKTKLPSYHLNELHTMKKNNATTDAARLRQRAEELLKKKLPEKKLHLSETELLKLIHELEVHQIELELQNEELMQARSSAQEAAEKYLEMYDFAPIGYLTLSKEGEILEINLAASQMLGKERINLKSSQFGFFISDTTKPIFNQFLYKIFNGNKKETCEVILSVNTNIPIYVNLTGIIDRDREQCLLTIIDITIQKKAETELEKWASIFKPKSN